VLHRDRKPANILLGEGDEPLVADFGLARFLDRVTCQTRPGQVLGSVPYMAPEQATGQSHRASPATDVWALGVILYELLCGHRPFRGATYSEVLRLIESAAPAPLRARNPDVPAELEAVCFRCLAKAPGDRYRTAAQLADDLQAWLEGRPLATPPSTRTFAGSGGWFGGRRAPVTALLGTALLLFASALALAAERPPPPPPPDPAEQLRALLRQAAPGKPVVLYKKGRQPRWSKFELGAGLSKAVFPPGKKRPALVSSPWFGLLELVPPDPQRGDYRLHVVLTPVPGDELTYYGLYAGRKPFVHATGRGHTLLTATFPGHDLRRPPPVDTRVYPALLSIFQPKEGAINNFRTPLNPSAVVVEGTPRAFALEVRRGEARVVSGERHAAALPVVLALGLRLHEKWLPQMKGHRPDLSPTGGAGLILCRGMVHVERIVYEPLPPLP
jgi:hypothetical protein